MTAETELGPVIHAPARLRLMLGSRLAGQDQ
jgi:hypothetical protein